VRFVAKQGIIPSDAAASEVATSVESAKDDPLIQEALEMFNAQIKP